jgi:hypothetical protein
LLNWCREYLEKTNYQDNNADTTKCYVAEFVMMKFRFLTNRGKGYCFDLQFKKKKRGRMGLVSIITLLNLPINFLMEYCDGKYRQSIQMMTCHFNVRITDKIFFYFLIIFIFW